MIKNFVFILILTLSYGDSFSQSKYGVDSVKCITNLSLFREYYKKELHGGSKPMEMDVSKLSKKLVVIFIKMAPSLLNL